MMSREQIYHEAVSGLMSGVLLLGAGWSPHKPARTLGRDLSIGEDRLAAKDGPANLASKWHSHVRAHLMPLKESVLLQ